MSALWGGVSKRQPLTPPISKLREWCWWWGGGGAGGVELDSSSPASDVATHDDAEALQQGGEELVDGHVGRRGSSSHGAVGYVLPMDEHKPVGGLHGDGEEGLLGKDTSTSA